MIGRTIGNYVVLKQIGQGGMGVVYLAEHPRIHRQVAIKVLLPQYSSNPQVVQRFFNEAKAATEVHSEHIIDIIDFGELDDGASYIIMEWLDGKSLADALDEAGKLPLPRAIHITRGIGRALAAAHKHGIIHRDLKPDNIFLIRHNGDDDFVKVLDFGIAKLTGSDQAASDVKTKTGALIGTPSFMSPEQCRGIAIDQRSDIYSLGVIVYRMLTGRLPFEAEALGELLLQHMTQKPISLREHDPGLPPSVDAAVLRSLEKDPQKRQPHVDDLLRELAGVHTGAFPTYDDGKSSPDTLAAAAGERAQGTASRAIGRWAVIGGVAAAVAGGIAFMTIKPPAAVVAPVPLVAPVAMPVVAPVPTPVPAPIPAATPSHDVPAPATEVHVVIRAQPAGAELTLDDAKIENPFDGHFARGDAKHHLVAKASGHRAESSWVSFDQDRQIDIALVKGSGSVNRDEPRKLPTLPAGKVEPEAAVPTVAAPKKPEPQKPSEKPSEKSPGTKPVAPDKPDNPAKPVYKGTKGKLITEFPDSEN